MAIEILSLLVAHGQHQRLRALLFVRSLNLPHECLRRLVIITANLFGEGCFARYEACILCNPEHVDRTLVAQLRASVFEWTPLYKMRFGAQVDCLACSGRPSYTLCQTPSHTAHCL